MRCAGGDSVSLLKVMSVPNGDIFTRIEVYLCDRCFIEINEAHPHANPENDVHYCWDCGFIKGLISEKKYLSCVGIGIANANATVRNGEVVIWIGKRPPWERTPQDIRNSKEYADWRKSVYERDKYTCQHCGQVGGELNAHHIKPFAQYKELRFELSNGLTLCVECHREVHRKGD